MIMTLRSHPAADSISNLVLKFRTTPQEQQHKRNTNLSNTIYTTLERQNCILEEVIKN
jgi:hypothetical protein